MATSNTAPGIAATSRLSCVPSKTPSVAKNGRPKRGAGVSPAVAQASAPLGAGLPTPPALLTVSDLPVGRGLPTPPIILTEGLKEVLETCGRLTGTVGRPCQNCARVGWASSPIAVSEMVGKALSTHSGQSGFP